MASWNIWGKVKAAAAAVKTTVTSTYAKAVEAVTGRPMPTATPKPTPKPTPAAKAPKPSPKPMPAPTPAATIKAAVKKVDGALTELMTGKAPTPAAKAPQPRGMRDATRTKIWRALERMEHGDSLTKAAKTAGVSPKAVRDFRPENWAPAQKGRPLRFAANAEGKTGDTLRTEFRDADGDLQEASFAGADASLISRYLNARERVLGGFDPRALEVYEDETVTDIYGRTFTLQTDIETIMRENHVLRVSKASSQKRGKRAA